MTSRRALAALTLTIAGLSLAGCAGPGAPGAAAPVPTPTVTMTVTATPEPTPTQTADTITCETAFTADFIAGITEDGLVFNGDQYTEHLTSVAGEDGLRCRWGVPQTDLFVEYANWERTDGEWESLKAELLAKGYVEAGPFALKLAATEYDSALRFRNGIVHYASPARDLGWVAELQ